VGELSRRAWLGGRPGEQSADAPQLGDVCAAGRTVNEVSEQPLPIRVGQGTEFVSHDVDLWAYRRDVTLDLSRPGKPTDNAFIESFNRAECLNAHWFMSLDEARRKCEAWDRDYM
jgi:transposase InsO family protein